MGKILLYETPIIYFLKQTIINLMQWKKLSYVQEQINNQYKERLIDLFEKFEEELPDYCYGVLGLLNNILYEEKEWKEKQKEMINTIHICRILLEKPSVETFERLVDWNYTTLCSDYRYTEDILNRILNKAFKLQLKYEMYFQHSQTFQEKKKYQIKMKENDIFWIAIVRMRTVTEEILLKAIRYAKLRTWAFYCFCIEIVGNPNTTEKVWFALLERIYKEKVRKARIITSIFQIKCPEPRIIKRAVELITSENKYYYDFCFLIISKYRNEKSVIDYIRKKFERTKLIVNGPMHYKQKRLQLILNNVCL